MAIDIILHYLQIIHINNDNYVFTFTQYIHLCVRSFNFAYICILSL